MCNTPSTFPLSVYYSHQHHHQPKKIHHQQPITSSPSIQIECAGAEVIIGSCPICISLSNFITLISIETAILFFINYIIWTSDIGFDFVSYIKNFHSTQTDEKYKTNRETNSRFSHVCVPSHLYVRETINQHTHHWCPVITSTEKAEINRINEFCQPQSLICPIHWNRRVQIVKTDFQNLHLNIYSGIKDVKWRKFETLENTYL